MREGRRRPSLRERHPQIVFRRVGRNEGGAPAPLVATPRPPDRPPHRTAAMREGRRRPSLLRRERTPRQPPNRRNEGGAPAPLVGLTVEVATTRVEVPQ